MESELQSAVIPAFHYSLLPGAILLLGGSESAARHQDLFEPFDKAARIFKRRNVKSPALSIDFRPQPDLPLHVFSKHQICHRRSSPGPRRSSRGSMSSLLDDLLDVSRITRGSFPLKKELIEVKSLIEAAVEAAQPLMDVKRHALHVEIPEKPILVNADPIRLAQVMSNLLTNAAKYTPPGGIITVGSYLEAQDLIVFVRDNGIGLAPEMIPEIFEMFSQVKSPNGASESGLGIGLALSRGLVQLHGGRITAKSAGLGKGSEFVVALPRTLVAESPRSISSGVDGETNSHISRRVLLADDNRDGAESLGMVLELAGHQVTLAHSGSQALELARQEDKRNAEAAGFDHHCTKPVDPDDLQRFFESSRSS
jgi:CheY-like chemotaxis protein